MTASKILRVTAPKGRRLPACVCGLLAIASTAAWAQVATPLLGFLPDQGQIRPVNGIPASASVAAPLDFGGVEFHQIAIAPRQNFAVVSSLSTGAVFLAYPSGSTQPLAGVAAYPDGISMSPSGSAAVLWFASPHLLQIVSGLPGSPVVRQIDASFLTGSGDLPSSLTVSDDGAWGAGAWPSGVWSFGPNSEVRNLLAGERAYAVAFFAGRQDLAAATRTQIFSVTDVGGSAATALLYASPSGGAPSGFIQPSGLGISTDNRRLVLANRDGSMLTLDLNSGSAAQIDCGCVPSGVFPMGASLFRITGLTGAVFRVFDAASGSVFLAPLAGDAQ